MSEAHVTTTGQESRRRAKTPTRADLAKPNFDPGTSFVYEGAGFLKAEVVEALTELLPEKERRRAPAFFESLGSSLQRWHERWQDSDKTAAQERDRDETAAQGREALLLLVARSHQARSAMLNLVQRTPRAYRNFHAREYDIGVRNPEALLLEQAWDALDLVERCSMKAVELTTVTKQSRSTHLHSEMIAKAAVEAYKGTFDELPTRRHGAWFANFVDELATGFGHRCGSTVVRGVIEQFAKEDAA